MPHPAPLSNVVHRPQQGGVTVVRPQVELLAFSVGRLLEVQLVDFPTSLSLTHVFGIGSVLGIYLGTQVGSGVLLSLSYVPSGVEAYQSVLQVIVEASQGSVLYVVHSVGAGMVFLLVYSHMGKYMMVRSLSTYALLTGTVLLVLIVASSFLGYVLVWQQMSYWAATVITTLLSVLPDGDELLTVLWGAFTLDSTTLTRFYSLHYLITLVSAALAIVHLFALHLLGSSSGHMLKDTLDTISFSRYYLIKDVLLLAVVYLLYMDVLYTEPTLFSDPELAIMINTMSTPPHIVPEWYLLGYYATLRGIPSKSQGIAMVALVLVAVFISAMPSLVHLEEA